MKPWDGIVSEDEQAAYRAAGFGRKSGLGKRPALLIIDVQYRTVGTKPAPFWEAIKEFPTSCGEVGWAAVAQIAKLLQLFRSCGWPVLYPYVAPKESFDSGRLAEKVPALMEIPGTATISSPRSRRRATCCCRRSTRAPSSARRSRAT